MFAPRLCACFCVALTPILVTSLCLSFFGCGGQPALPGLLSLDTWNRDGGMVGGDADGAGDPAGTSGAADGVSVVAGQTEQRTGEPVLFVSTASLNFGAQAARQVFWVSNWGSGTMLYTVRSDVDWATAIPASGANVGGEDRIEVAVDRTGLEDGRYSGRLVVATDDGQTHDVAINMQVAPAVLEISADILDFGSTGWTRTFTLRNVGGGVLSYTVEANVDWLIVEPPSGEASSEIDRIDVSIRRDPLLLGEHEALLTVQTDASPDIVLQVLAEKALTTPRIVPWMECNSFDPLVIQEAVTALLRWRYLTDTAIVSTTPEHATLYTRLRQEVPDMNVIPGIKTYARLGAHGLDSLEGWRLIAQDVADVVVTSGQKRVVLENESAAWAYLHRECEIDHAQMRQCLSFLPQDVEIIWYPGPLSRHPGSPSDVLCRLVEDVLECRFVDKSYDRPVKLGEDEWYWQQVRDLYSQYVTNTPTPIIYFGCWGLGRCDWEYEQMLQIMGFLTRYDDMIVYPSRGSWAEAPEIIQAELSLDPPLP